MSNRTIPGLDGVRAIALLIVLVAHAATTPRFPWAGMLDSMPHFGKFGVLIFFVLSGFLQTSLLLNDELRTGQISIRRFYAKRVLRIVPLLLIYLGFVIVWALTTKHDIEPIDAASVLLCFRHAMLGAPLLVHFWSLSLEMLFYLSWPFILHRVPAPRRMVFTMTLVVLLPLTSPLLRTWIPDTDRWQWSQFFRCEAILLGCCLALPGRNRVAAWKQWVSKRPDLLFITAVAVAIGAAFAKGWIARDWADTVFYWVQVAAAVTIVQSSMTCRWGLLKGGLNSWSARWLAMISFGSYVWQQFFFFGNPNDWIQSWPPRNVQLWTFWFPVNIALSLMMGAFSFYLIERPLHPLRERLAGPPRPIVPRSLAAEARV